MPVEGIVVTVKSLSSEDNSVLITDNRGMVKLNQTAPYIVHTYHFAFNAISDTIYNVDNI
jgi:hypothetical protein